MQRSYFQTSFHMSARERLASLDRARVAVERRLAYAQNADAVDKCKTILKTMAQRRIPLEARLNSKESLIERALCAPEKSPDLIPRYGNWMAHVFHDTSFIVHKTPGDGSCLFHVVSGATGQTAASIKRTVAQSATQEEFVTKKALWNSAVEEYPRIQQRLAQTPPTSPYYNGLQQQLAHLADDVHTYRWLADIATLAAYRKALARQGTWGDADAVGHIENTLNLKLLIFSLQSRERPQIYCNTMIPEGFHPSHYILVAYHPAEAHYDLVKHAGRAMFTFEQLPYSVRRLFEQECPQLKELGGWASDESVQ